MPTYKTPNVYVEEISLLPRSVAEVATAIPAFIGYTAKASDGQSDLKLVPTAVDSLVELESIFGGEPEVQIVPNSLVLDANSNVQSVDFATGYQLYDALRLFYANGGGRCYIVSVGDYSTDVSGEDLQKGLAAVRKEDEPTLLLLPDAVLLDDGLYDVQKAALQQCADLKDRFAILDLREDAGWEAGVLEFRDKIGVNNLLYGAAYTPHLCTTLPMQVTFRELAAHIPTIRNSTDPDVLAAFVNVENAVADADEVRTSDAAKLNEEYDAKLTTFRTALNARDLAASQAAFKDLFDFTYTKNVALLDTLAKNAGPELKSPEVIDAVRNVIIGSIRAVFKTLNSYNRHAGTTSGAGGLDDLYTAAGRKADAPQWTVGADNSFDAALAADDSIYPQPAPASDDQRFLNMRSAEPRITALFRQFASGVASVIATADQHEQTMEDALRAKNPLYARVAKGVGSARRTVPPCGAIAGIYAYVDQSRGVWKAPANVSLNQVSDVTHQIDDDEQADLNVDTTAGKSINAIRTFTGRGILSWGARTLAGNDNEWRYIPVRRFFIMVEESVKKSTLWAVFESNDANLWVKVKAMIENYLIEKWRDGALAGAKPADAFFVNVGLGVTMTAQDILEGRLIVEIGLAVVRPAEFIILRFSHKLQTS